MFSKYSVKISLAALLTIGSLAVTAYAVHSWGSYHWARTANPFTLKLGDNVSSAWDSYLITTAADWSVSDVLDTAKVTGGTNPRKCRATSGRVEVCSANYGFNGWLGLAQIWISGNHITKGVTKLNDSYFNTATYNKPGWRNLVMCQEVGHNLGLDHQDVKFDNANLGSCMDYTDDPDGTLKGQLSNEHPNIHDYEQLGLIYAHFDSSTTIGADAGGPGKGKGNNGDAAEWGKSIREDGKGRPSHFVRELGNGEKVFTFVIWAD